MGEGDKAGLAAIKAPHHQLDDDHDGTIEPQETGDFIKADLKVIACQGSMRSCRYIYEHEGKKETLPKAQRTRGLSSTFQSNFFGSYHEFKCKS